MTATTPGRAALLLGATGLVGRRCLARLLDDATWGPIHVLTRRPTGVAHPRLIEVARVAPEDVPPVEDVFCCLGTTIKAAGSRGAFRAVDHDLVVSLARQARERGARRLALVSSVGADPRSRAFYLRTKGEAERDVAALGFECVEVLRPSFLVGAREVPRRLEAAGIAVSSALAGLLVGPARRYRPIDADTVAGAQRAALRRGEAGGHLREHADLVRLAG
ncbi:MAG: NAD(P)H-binding protein [Planctomycetes bacterium]|nr:NAD(P)H-binding protein [Planctomycetota bacterium]